MAILINKTNAKGFIFSAFNKKWLYILSGLVFLVAIVFSLFYLTSEYEYLKNWFVSLNDCFYRKEDWSNSFFTPTTKSKGNIFCALAIAVSVAGLFYILRQFILQNRQLKNTKTEAKINENPNLNPVSIHVFLNLSFADIFWILAIIIVSTFAWFWGNSLITPAFDEAFSAVSISELYPFQSVSYYMLPNNHLLFNLLNSVFFFFTEKKVATGRFISLLAYLGLLITAYYWFSTFIKNKFFVFLAVITLALQFPVWGFSFQNRGYALYALAQWLVFVSLFQYIQTKKGHWLLVNSFACIIGYCVMPSFLYFHAAQLSFLFIYQIAISKKIDFEVWKYQAFAFVFVFLFHLPALTFSGVSAFTENRYVKPMSDNLRDFAPSVFPVLDSYLDYCFSNFNDAAKPLSFVLFLLPFSLLFFLHKKPKLFLYGLFYLLMIAAVIFFIFWMKRYPYHRNLTGHFSIALAMVIGVVYLGIKFISLRLKTSYFQWLVFPALLIFTSLHFIENNKKHVFFSLYSYDVNAIFHVIQNEGINNLPVGSSVAFSDESFYWYFLGRKRGLKTNKCFQGNEDYLIKLKGEEIPGLMKENMSKYKLDKEVLDYEIYKREE